MGFHQGLKVRTVFSRNLLPESVRDDRESSDCSGFHCGELELIADFVRFILKEVL